MFFKVYLFYFHFLVLKAIFSEYWMFSLPIGCSFCTICAKEARRNLIVSLGLTTKGIEAIGRTNGEIFILFPQNEQC